VERGEIRVRDATCPAIHSGLQAAEKGVPYMPIGGILGSDLVAQRPDWRVIDNVLFIPAIKPDVALFHARWADEAGNVWVGRRRELATVAHASKTVLVTFEELRKGDMLEDELLAPGVISSITSRRSHTRRAAPGRSAWRVSTLPTTCIFRNTPGRRRRARASSAISTNGSVRQGRASRLRDRPPAGG
jgi:hypothetical protein